MKTLDLNVRCAGAAIAAVLALGSTPVLAQDAATGTPVATTQPADAAPAPAVILPSQAAPVATPEIVLPDFPVETTTETNTESTVPAAAPSTAPAAAPVTRTQSSAAPAPRVAASPAARSGAAPAATTTSPEPAPVAQSEISENAGADFETAPLPVASMDSQPIQESVPVDAAAAESGDLSPTAILLGLLVALGLAGVGVVALGRRSKPAAKAAPVIERPVVATPERVVTVDAAPVSRPATDIREWSQPATASSSAPHSGAAVALPRSMPETYEERDALMRRMVAAKPDRANPFRAPGARARRARLIMQSLGSKFDNREPWIDLSQYTGNWPELAGRRTSYAA